MSKFFILGACTATLAFAAVANAQCPPAGNDCCTTGGPGCSDTVCCDQVCAVDPFCCDTAWDGICVGEAVTICGLDCASCPKSDHGCFSTGGPGCTDVECCEAVCAVDLFCCQTAWDGICVNEAFAFCTPPLCCNLRCPADLNYDGQVDGGDLGILLADWGATTTCSNLDGQGTVDGGDLGILLAAWGDCLGANYVLEPEPCGDDLDGGCNVPIIGDSNCCFASGGLGCDDVDCTLAVCGVDPFCCDTAWDGICASEAIALCPKLCQQGVPAFAPIACGDKVIGTAWADGNIRDTDWYEITFTEPTLITLTMQSQLPMVFGVIDTGGVPDCALAAAINPFGTTGFCGSATIADICLGPGTWWLFAAPNGFTGFPCGANNQYWFEVECGGKCVPPACGISDHDCFTTGGPFCSDEDCCLTVCGVDPFCCDTAWDGICVSEAQAFCVSCEDFPCPGAPENEPCGTDTNGGCNSIPPIFGSIACGGSICGNGWAAGGTRDTDWFEFTLDTAQTVTVSGSAQFPFVLGVVDTGGVPDCSLATAINPFAQGNACGTAEATGCLAAGTWWVFVAPSVFDGFPCDGGNNAYTVTLTCSGKECSPAACGNAGHDCFTVGGPFCDDIACCELVCGIDPFCCDTSWDGICVQEALDFCGADPIVNDECVDRLPIGLGSTDYTTIGATTSGPDLPAECAKGGFALTLVNDIWYNYTAGSDGVLTVDLCASTYDTRMAIYSGNCDNLVLEGCNDDFCGLQSTLSVPVSSGTTYIIRIGGFSGSGSGTAVLSQ